MADSSQQLQGTLEKLKAAVGKAHREVHGLLTVAERQVKGPDKDKLELGLKEVNDQLKVLDIHIGDIQSDGNKYSK
jgi:hypothetical protein